MKKLFLLIPFLLGALLLSLYNNSITNSFIENTGISWNFAYWLPKILVLICAYFCAKIISNFLTLNKSLKVVSVLLVFFGIIGVSFALSPIYAGDLNKKGLELSSEDYKNNKTLEKIKADFPNFNGVFYIASSSCPHCKLATQKFSTLKNRKPDVDVLVIMYSNDQIDIDDFISETDADNLNYMLVYNNKATFDLCDGRFPTFFYLKDNQLQHKWTNDQMGFAAFSWIENKLN